MKLGASRSSLSGGNEETEELFFNNKKRQSKIRSHGAPFSGETKKLRQLSQFGDGAEGRTKRLPVRLLCSYGTKNR